MEKISLEDFNHLAESGKLVFIDFFAEWCGPCQMMMPIIDEVKEDYKDNEKVVILKVDTDESPEIASRFDVMSVPTFIFLQNNEAKHRIVGATTKENITSKITELLK